MRSARLLIPLLLGTVFAAQAARQARTTLQEYVVRYRRIAVEHQEKYGIPASITLAQGILESDCGNGRLAVAANNHFGIKCKRDWKGGRISHDDDAPGECFRSYRSAEESYEDHARYLDTQPRYDSLFAYAPTDYRSWARGLKAAGYATDPLYAQKLVRIIEENDLHLYDRGLESVAQAAALESPLGAPSQAAAVTALTVVDVDHYRIPLTERGGYPVYMNNRVPYVTARPGDTYASLARALAMPERRLRRYNDAGPSDSLATGEAVYLRSKRPRSESSQLHHTVAAGESLRDVAQRYGVKRSRLASLNGLGREGRVHEGQHIRLR